MSSALPNPTDRCIALATSIRTVIRGRRSERERRGQVQGVEGAALWHGCLAIACSSRATSEHAQQMRSNPPETGEGGSRTIKVLGHSFLGS